jgi:hypothetical protein
MDGFEKETPSPNGSLLPPAITRRKSFRTSASTQSAPLAPPYIAGGRAKSDVPPAHVEAPTEATAKPEDVEAMIWDPMSDDGVVEPAFEADSESVLDSLSHQAPDNREEFPLEAFIVPEQAQHVPSGLEGKPIQPHPEPTAMTSLAERLEKLSHRLRIDETDEIVRRLAAGDRLDTLLAGLLAGYLAGTSEQQ